MQCKSKCVKECKRYQVTDTNWCVTTDQKVGGSNPLTHAMSKGWKPWKINGFRLFLCLLNWVRTCDFLWQGNSGKTSWQMPFPWYSDFPQESVDCRYTLMLPRVCSVPGVSFGIVHDFVFVKLFYFFRVNIFSISAIVLSVILSLIKRFFSLDFSISVCIVVRLFDFKWLKE